MKPEPWKPGPLMGHINYVSVEAVGIRHNEHECHMRICKKNKSDYDKLEWYTIIHISMGI